MLASIAGAALAVLPRLGSQRRRQATQRRFVQTFFEKLNPFQEKPEEETKRRFASVVDAVNALEPNMKAKSDDELRALTAELQNKARNGSSLDDLLPEAFALVREASFRVLGLRHFDVQIMGGCALHSGNIAEMGTGEGKTLVAILPACLNALTGKGCHVVTVNDYLARRDAEWVGQPLRFLGMTVGVVQGGMMPEQKRKAYRCDVTYVTNSELGFDYLRDQMAPSPSDLCLREKTPFNFAVVDEVDSILIDEARTPLIISGESKSPSSKYQIAREVSKSLRKTVHYTLDEKQRQVLMTESGQELAEQLLDKNDLFDPADPWFPFVTNALNAKEMYLKDKQYIVKKGEIMIVDEFTGRVMQGRRWSNGLHQAIEAKENVKIQSESVTLASISYQSLFRLFDKLSGMTGTAFTEAKEFEEIYKLQVAVLPPNRIRRREDKDDQVFVDDIGKWKAVAREVENAHRIGRPVLIGTTNVENSEILSELLDALGVPYQLLNAKPENTARETEIVAGSGRQYAVTIATNMAGRGTDILLGGNSSMMARLKIREELYPRLFPKNIKANWTMPTEFYPIDLSIDAVEKVSKAVSLAVKTWLQAASDKPTSLAASQRMVEAELTELEVEERLSLACEKAPTDDQVLLLLRDAYNTICQEFKHITDLEKERVVSLGGLYVLGTERHESRRIDNQLRGRCARQGDPGATRFYLSLNDQIFRIFGGDQIKKMMGMMSFTGTDDAPLTSSMLSTSLEEAQKKVESFYYSVRKNVFDYDDVMDTQRRIVYSLRRQALLDSDDIIRETTLEFSEKNMEDFVLKGSIQPTTPVETWPLEQLCQNVYEYSTALVDKVTPELLRSAAGGGGESGLANVTTFLKAQGRAAFEAKQRDIEANGPGLCGMVTRQVLLMQVDNFWREHLKNMDFMKTGVQMRAYGQKNPLTEYKLEGYQVFLKMMARIRRNTIYNVCLFTPRKLKPMSKERIQSLIPNREERRRQMQEILALSRPGQKIPLSEVQPSAVNLARLALNVRQLLEAREALKDLALAGFSELKETFFRVGLLTLGDQLRWASATADFELLEDDQEQDFYIGFKRREGEAGKDPTDVREMADAREAIKDALNSEDFMQSVEEMSSRPADFLAMLQESASKEGWTADDVKKIRRTYEAAGVNLDEMLESMEASLSEMPEDQRKVVEYMQKLLRSPEEGLAAAREAEALSKAPLRLIERFQEP